MEALAPFHPAIVHAPIALIIVGAVFELMGRALDSEWWRKAAFAMLIVGVLGAAAAVLSGRAAEEGVERQGVSEHAIEEHEDVALLALWLGIAAVVTRAVTGRLGAARAAVAGLALLLHLAAATTVGIAGYRGGRRVFEHGAGVKVGGELLENP
ncbi:MAG: DUF2231 domain-containing protein, partial [Candidatus Eisenbacteria bacterium]